MRSWGWAPMMRRVPYKKTKRLELVHSLQCEDICKTSHLQTRKRALTRHAICQHAELGLSKSQTARNKRLLVKPLSLWYVCYSSPSKLRQCHKAEINLLARYIVIQRPHEGKTHFQAASSCWQYWFPWGCMTEVPIFLLQLSAGEHSSYWRMLSSPCHVAPSLPEAPSHFKSISSEGTRSLLRAQLIRSGPPFFWLTQSQLIWNLNCIWKIPSLMSHNIP